MGSELPDLPEKSPLAVHFLEQRASLLWAAVSSAQCRGVKRIEWV